MFVSFRLAYFSAALEENDKKSSGEEHQRQTAPTASSSLVTGATKRQGSSITPLLSSCSTPIDAAAQQHAKEEIKKLESKKTEYANLLAKLKQTGKSEISFTDPECRAMKNNERIEPCYNAQISVDSKFHLIPEYHVTNEPADHRWLSFIAKSTKAVLGVGKLDVTADRGFFNVQTMKDCLDNGIVPYVPEYTTSRKDGRGVPSRDFQRDKFVYDEIGDRFLCPAGHELLFRTWDTDRYGNRNLSLSEAKRENEEDSQRRESVSVVNRKENISERRTTTSLGKMPSFKSLRKSQLKTGSDLNPSLLIYPSDPILTEITFEMIISVDCALTVR